MVINSIGRPAFGAGRQGAGQEKILREIGISSAKRWLDILACRANALRRSLGLGVAICFLAIPGLANAAPVTFNFAGQITDVPPEITFMSVGDPFAGYYTFESTSPNVATGPAGPAGTNEKGQYQSFGLTFGMSVTIQGVIYDRFGYASVEASRFVPSGCCGADQSSYNVAATSVSGFPSIGTAEYISINLQTNNMNRGLPDNTLPLSPVDVSLFENHAFFLFLTLPNDLQLLLVTGEVSEISAAPGAVPLPATLPLFAAGLGGMGLLGWRRARRKVAAVAAA